MNRGVVGSLLLVSLLASASPMVAQSASRPHEPTPDTLAREFFTAIRGGNASKILSYIPERGVNVGAQAQHVTRKDAEQQFAAHRGLFCKLFDSSCIQSTIDLENSTRVCSDRELLSPPAKVHIAASQVTRSGVQQAVVVARVDNRHCPTQKLIDFIFNLDADGWKLFSVP